MKYFSFNGGFKLESGEELASPVIAYHSYGTLNKEGNNVIWICHALTANSDVANWWTGLFGENNVFDPSKYFIVCANVLGSCYGSTGPLSENPENGKPYFHDFPFLSIRDLTKAHINLRKHLEIKSIKMLVGGSLGGQQALEWAIEEPKIINRLILIATNAIHSPWGIAFNESQRMAIQTDPSFLRQSPDAGLAGLRTARSIAMLSYRTYETYQLSQEDRNRKLGEEAKAATYQRYQGDKLVKRFNAFSYISLLNAMDSHDVGRNRPSIEYALQQVQAPTLVLSINSDLLFPIDEQRLLAMFIPKATHKIIDSLYGHDGFLIEHQSIKRNIIQFILDNSTLIYENREN